MALTKSFKTQMGLEAKNAYAIVKDVSINRLNKNALISFSVFYNETARNNGEEPVTIFKHRAMNRTFPEEDNKEDQMHFDDYFSIDKLDAQDTNPVKQAYLYLKEQEGYNTWTDC